MSKKFSKNFLKNFPKKILKKYYSLFIAIIVIAVIFTINIIGEKNIQEQEKLANKPSKEITQPIEESKKDKKIENKKENRGREQIKTVLRESEWESIPVYSDSSCKLWMDYRAITNIDSVQWQLLQKAVVGDDGVLRIDGYVCVALGRSYGNLGDKFIFQIGNKRIKCIFTDMKADFDTLNGEGWLDPYGNILEIIVDEYQINSVSRSMGDMNYTDSLSGKIIHIWREQ